MSSTFYILEIYAEPPADKHVFYVASDLTEVHGHLQKDLTRDPDLAICYGEQIELHKCKLLNKSRGEAIVISSFDLHPTLTFFVGDFQPIRFDEEQKVIGFTNFLEQSPSDADPIDFSSTNLQEVHRYLMYDVYEIFRIMREQGVQGSNMERYPPRVGVQIDLSFLPRAENPVRHLNSIVVTLKGEKLELNHGIN